MTSDRGNGGAAELQLTPNSVTQKSPGLNPNATEFLSKQDVHHWGDINADGYQYANGDINKLEGSSGVFSPAAGSEPPLQPISADFTSAATGPVPLLPVSPAPPPAAVTDQIVSAVNTGPTGGGGGAGAGSAGAGAIIGTTGIPTTSSPLIYSTQTETATLQDESPAQVDGTLSDEQIRKMLKSQLEYYFSRENLTSDTYLMSQMDADQYVAISAVASFSQVQRLTSNLDLVVDVLRECQNVQVDEKGEKVRPNHNRCIVILREIPASTPVEEVENLFSGTNCPKFVSCEFAHNDNWYVTFDSDEDAQRAYQYLREEVKSFLGKPIMARIKAKPLIRSSYVPRNGLKPHFEQQTFPSPQRYAFLPNLQYGQQVFYHPGHAVLSSWAPAAPTIMDPSMVFAMNGYQATGVKLNATGRHQFTNIRVSRTPKPHRLNQERASSDSRLSHDRHQNPNAHRSSPRSTENAHVAAAPFLQRKSSENSGHHNNHPLHHIQQHSSGAGISGNSSSNSGGGGGGGGGTGSAGSLAATVPVHHSSAASDSSASINVSLLSDSTKDSPASQPQRKLYNKGRRKKDEDYSKLSRQNSSQISANNKYTEPQFEFESNSFPPLPGSQNNASSGERFENKMSDVVRGTAKPLAKESVIASPVVAAPASSSSSSPSSSTTGVPATGTNAVVVVAPPPLMSTSSSSSSSAVTAIGLNTQAPLLASTLLQSAASKEVSTAGASSILAPLPPPPTPASAVVSSSSLALASAPAVAPPATVASASHVPLIAATSTLSSSASATSANNRALAQTSQPVCLTNKPSCAIASPSNKLNCVNPVDHSKSADSHHPVSLVGGSQSHQVAVVTSPPTAAAAVATTTASPKETGVGSATSCAHSTPASSSQSLSVSSLPLSSLSSSGHALQAPPPSGASSSSSTQQGHSRPGRQQAAALQGMMTSSAGATSSSAALTATSTLALQQQQQNAKVSAMEERATSKLSYAQMVARKRDPGNDGGAPMSSSEKSQSPVSQQTPSAALQQQQQVHSGAGEASMCKMMANNLLQPTSSSPSQRSQALKEQSQALKVSSPSAAHMQLPPKEHILRKDLEPKEQRFNMGGRRPAKENRERQRRKTDRERTSK